ncbi:MAG: glycosyltransferase family A protein [Lachnospiraceae bacterium]|nr:glycosyltransferase family A protein [Lachnospiraceae bacterium]
MKHFHTFAVCAYKDSPYLEACIRSVTGQSCRTSVILCTSTPSPYIHGLAAKYGIPVYVREGESDIQADWNFAFEMADARFVTIAHQDDMYGRDYVKTLEAYAKRFDDITMFTTDYTTVRDHELVPGERLVLVKRLLRLPLMLPELNHLTFVKKSALRFGNSICCPACTYQKERLGQPLFASDCKFALDWDTLITLAEKPGRFICAERPLVFHRLHKDAATNTCMKDSRRYREEVRMFGRLWPEPVVRLLMKFYQKAYESYEV